MFNYPIVIDTVERTNKQTKHKWDGVTVDGAKCRKLLVETAIHFHGYKLIFKLVLV